MAYQEQLQLFRFDWNYLHNFLIKPGGLTEYIGDFLIQFYVYPLIGAFIITIAGIAVYILTRYIFRKYRITGPIWLYIPALLLIVLQNDYMFDIGYVLGLLFVLTFFAIYISLRIRIIRFTIGLVGWVFLYMTAGEFALLATLICFIHELFFTKDRYRLLLASGFAVIAVVFPYIACHTIYLIPLKEAWLNPNYFTLIKITKFTFILSLLYFPFLLILVKILPEALKETLLRFGWNWKTGFIGIIILAVFIAGIKKYAYEPDLRLFLEIDHNIQHAKWDRVLELSSKSSVTNHLILYYTNLALYKTGHLGDRLFYYKQIGIPGLWLNRDKDEISLFLGGELYYHLGNINEANRWAFDAMVANGQYPPRLMKQLVLTSLINGDLIVAGKYLNIVDQSLFYRNWAKHYRSYLSNPNVLNSDPEIAMKRHFLIHSDLIAGSINSDIGLKKLLEVHPDNRMVFEYYMSSLLLEKNLVDFVANIKRIKDFGFKNLPVHYEEALLIYMDYTKRNAVPQGYGIRKTTVQRYMDYSKAYSSRKGSSETAAQYFYKLYDNTYWFYLHFINNRASSYESTHPFN